MKIIKKRAIIISLIVIIFSFSNTVVLSHRSYRQLVATMQYPQDFNHANIIEGRILIPLRPLVEIFGTKVDWNPSPNSQGDGRITLTFYDNIEIYSLPIPVTVIEISFQDQSRKQVASINSQEYYFFSTQQSVFKEQGRIISPYRWIVEAFLEVEWNAKNYQVELYANPYFHRVKFHHPSQSLILNYVSHNFPLLLDTEHTLPYYPLKGFFSHLKAEIDASDLSEQILITSTKSRKSIQVFPKQNKAIIKSIRGDTYEITFQHSLKIQNEEIYITQEDFINLLDAEIHSYADSDVSLYLTFEW